MLYGMVHADSTFGKGHVRTSVRGGTIVSPASVFQFGHGDTGALLQVERVIYCSRGPTFCTYFYQLNVTDGTPSFHSPNEAERS